VAAGPAPRAYSSRRAPFRLQRAGGLRQRKQAHRRIGLSCTNGPVSALPTAHWSFMPRRRRVRKRSGTAERRSTWRRADRNHAYPRWAGRRGTGRDGRVPQRRTGLRRSRP